MSRQIIACLSLSSTLLLACVADIGDDEILDLLDDGERIDQVEQAELSRPKECWCEQWTECTGDYPIRVISQECYYATASRKCASKCSGYCRNEIGAKGNDIKGVCKNNFGKKGCATKSAGGV